MKYAEHPIDLPDPGPTDEPPVGSVIRFTKSWSGGKVYTYVALRTPIAWSRTGLDAPINWAELKGMGTDRQTGKFEFETLVAVDLVSGDDDEPQPTRWWQVVALDQSVWCETSDEDEARRSMRPGDMLKRLYERVDREWQTVSVAP